MANQTTDLDSGLVMASAITADNGAPTGAVGLDMTTGEYGAVRRPSKFLLLVEFTGTGALSVDLFLWGQLDGVWGVVGDDNGQLNKATSLTPTGSKNWWFSFQNLGAFERLYLEIDNISGTTATITATLYPLLEFGI